MALDPNNQTVSSRVLELGALFAMPLVSVIEADVLAAKEFTRFLYDFGFVADPTTAPDPDHLGALRTVSFSYKRPSANGGLEDAVVEIPLLSLVPLPLLQVTDAEFTFNVRVLESERSGLGAPPALVAPNAEAAPPPAAPADRTRIHAMLAQSPRETDDGAKRQSELDANMSVKLSMRQADVPAGISSLLNLMSQSIHSRNGQ